MMENPLIDLTVFFLVNETKQNKQEGRLYGDESVDNKFESLSFLERIQGEKKGWS